MNSQLRHIVIFGLGPLNQRDAASNGMSDCFAFAQQPMTPP